MSVHGEYARALETLIARVRPLGRPERDDWLAELEAARLDRQPDLTRAATACRGALRTLDDALGISSPRTPEALYAARGEPLREAWDHLLAHCRIILGDRD